MTATDRLKEDARADALDLIERTALAEFRGEFLGTDTRERIDAVVVRVRNLSPTEAKVYLRQFFSEYKDGVEAKHASRIREETGKTVCNALGIKYVPR